MSLSNQKSQFQEPVKMVSCSLSPSLSPLSVDGKWELSILLFTTLPRNNVREKEQNQVVSWRAADPLTTGNRADSHKTDLRSNLHSAARCYFPELWLPALSNCNCTVSSQSIEFIIT